MTNALIGTQPRHYERLGIAPGVIAAWEDGLRTAAADGTFEWWYFDAHLDDGSTVTVEFHTKPPYVAPSAPLTPFVLLTISAPDGSRIERTFVADAVEFEAATDGCDVRIGANTFRADDNGYTIHVEIDDVVADFTLQAEVPPWRPETGHAFFGPDEEHYIAWLPVVARGRVESAVTLGGETERCSGTGYHDHNWGNIAPRKVLDHWYWGRARIGDYTVVTLMFVSHDKFENTQLPAVMIARNGRIVASAVGTDRIDFTGGNLAEHEQTGVPFAKTLQYRVTQSDETFLVTFDHQRDAYTLDFGPAGAYLRFTGDVSIEHRDATGVRTESASTLWELLYFGQRRGAGSGAEIAPMRTAVIGHQA